MGTVIVWSSGRVRGYCITLNLKIARRLSKEEKVKGREENSRRRRAQRPGQSFVEDPWVVRR